MTTHKRIQRRRTKGYRMPEGAIYVGRPSCWGNDFEIGVDGDAAACVAAFAQAADDHRRYSPDLFEAWIAPLRGHDLACWCALIDKDGNPVPCHADVLLTLAAREEPDGS